MKHLLLNAFLICLCANINAQRFYIEPMVLSVIKKYSAQGGTFNEFTFNDGEVSFQIGSPSWQIDRKINFGLNAGIRGEMFHFEGGLFTGHITSMTRIKVGVDLQEKSLEYYRDMSVYRVNLNAGAKAFSFSKNMEPNTIRHELWLRLGMDIVLNRADYFLYQENKENFQLSDVTFNVTESYAYGYFKYMLMLNFGVKYRLNKGPKNLLCLNIYYCYREDRLGGGLYSNINIQHNSTSSSVSVTYQPPSGLNGFYFGLSKEFYLGKRNFNPKEKQLD
jgi:hypothetical protein